MNKSAAIRDIIRQNKNANKGEIAKQLNVTRQLVNLVWHKMYGKREQDLASAIILADQGVPLETIVETTGVYKRTANLWVSLHKKDIINQRNQRILELREQGLPASKIRYMLEPVMSEGQVWRIIDKIGGKRLRRKRRNSEQLQLDRSRAAFLRDEFKFNYNQIASDMEIPKTDVQNLLWYKGERR